MPDLEKPIRQAALLRNLIETCLRAASSPMSKKELAEWPSIREQTGAGQKGLWKLSGQLQRLVREGAVEKLGGGYATTYAWRGKSVAPQTPQAVQTDLRLRVDRSARTVSFSFLGLNITIEVAQ